MGLNFNILKFALKSLEIENKSFHRLVTDHNPLGFILNLDNL